MDELLGSFHHPNPRGSYLSQSFKDTLSIPSSSSRKKVVVCSPNKINSRSMSQHDPFLFQERAESPLDFPDCFLNGSSTIDGSPSKFTNEDYNSVLLSSTFQDLADQVDVQFDAGYPLFGSPSHVSLDRIEKEIFQDLKHTSTPKSPRPSFVDSGISISEGCQTRKRIRFASESLESPVKCGRSWQVLHDITVNNKVNSDATPGFIKLSDSGTINFAQVETEQPIFSVVNEVEIKTECAENTEPIPSQRKAGILRKSQRMRMQDLDLENEEDKGVPSSDIPLRDKDQVLYYTGFHDFECAIKLLNAVNLPTIDGMTVFKMQLMTLTKLKLNLEWRDLSFRYDVFEGKLFQLFNEALTIFSECFSELIPWKARPSGGTRKLSRLFYLHPFAYEDKCGQSRVIFVCIVNDRRRPIVFVSDPFPGDTKALTVVSTFSNHLLDGDEFCVKGFSRLDNKPTFFKIQKVDDRPSFNLQSDIGQDKANFVFTCRKVVKAMKNFKMLSDDVVAADRDMSRIISVVAGVTNVNFLHNISPSTLKLIRRRSSQLILDLKTAGTPSNSQS